MTANKLSAIVFFFFLVATMLISTFMPKREFSEAENRYLQDMPSPSVEGYLDSTYMEDVDTYTADHIVMRNVWIEAKTRIELISGKKEVGGVFVLEDRLIQRVSKANETEVARSISAINDYAQRYSNIPIYVMIAPTAQAVYADMLPKYAGVFDQQGFINDTYKELSDNIKKIDVSAVLNANRDEYIFYRNDHHWTTLGAYYAYMIAAKDMGLNPSSISTYDIEHASNDFKGTLYSKNLYNGFEADTIDFYHPTKGTNIVSVGVLGGDGMTNYDSMYFREYLGKKDKYSSFLGQNQPLVTIKTNKEDAGKLLIIKDSYAHCLAPFFTSHYSEITLVDLRYINIAISELVDVESYSQILVMYNATNFAEDTNIRKLNF